MKTVIILNWQTHKDVLNYRCAKIETLTPFWLHGGTIHHAEGYARPPYNLVKGSIDRYFATLEDLLNYYNLCLVNT